MPRSTSSTASSSRRAPATAKEDWIEFEWRDLSDLDAANLLPVEMGKFLVPEVPLRRKDRKLTREEALALIDRIPQIDAHIIVTNHKFAPIFDEWAAEQHYTKPINRK